MKVVIETILNIEGSRGMRRGEFYVRDQDYKDHADFAVSIVAYEWIQQQRKETGFRETIIEKVTWNNQHDITEEVKKIQPVIKDDLPF
ncbi:hypothetical protein J7I93_00015 [Bacillus sp. ISL-47]|uniref:hypothetical protein n=1 Tax=Bacillus sp. ISL-47 TaxID=2819130 RepID=UPI001BEAD400|nr:hypothetical protein [Bacillus sp. ISL-47]MBT2686559.1 hypothetical protein [Bacillus sp. ISL-47]MBT2706951.1 hypothetical protein [Pseudomonas sp. ISL-84]